MSAAKTNVDRQREFRARKAEQQATEVRGIFAHPDDHAEVKEAAAKIARRRARVAKAGRCGFTDVKRFGPIYRCTVCNKEMTQQWMDWIVWNKLPLPNEASAQGGMGMARPRPGQTVRCAP